MCGRKKYVKENDLIKDKTGYSSRLLTLDDFVNYLRFEYVETGTENYYESTTDTPNYFHGNFGYLTMSPVNDSSSSVWGFRDLNSPFRLYSMCVGKHTIIDEYVVRPVIIIKKSVIDGVEIIPNKEIKDITKNDYVDIPDTYSKKH